MTAVPISPADPMAAALRLALARGEIGVQVAAYRQGVLTADAWAGLCLGEAGQPVDGETLFPILSASKAVTAVAVQVQAERGLLDLEAPIAQVWPEFARNGKGEITAREVLSHRAGLAHLPPGTSVDSLLDWEGMTAAIAQLSPMFEHGNRNAYHALSGGYILGEVVRRTDPKRRAFGRFVQDEICGPLGIADLWIGLPDTQAPRCSAIVAAQWRAADPTQASLRAAAVPPAMGSPADFQNRADFRRACVPAGNGVANARALARLFAMLAGGGELDGVRLLSEARVRAMLAPRPESERADSVLGVPAPFGVGGLNTGHAAVDPLIGGGDLLWTHGGGGTYAWADLVTGEAGAICHNRLLTHAGPAAEHPYAGLMAMLRPSRNASRAA